MKLLIITNKDDITVDFVVDRLNERKIDYFRFNTEEIGVSVSIIFDFTTNNYMIQDISTGKNINLNEIGYVYFRRPLIVDPPMDLCQENYEYFWNEHSAILEGIYHILSNAKWLNNVFNIRMAENKVNQLVLAKSIGFLIPKSLITNIPNDAQKFISSNKSTVFKSIKCGLVSENNTTSRVLFTTKVDKKYIENIKSIFSLPTYFQEEIIKYSDIRVTIVGNSIFSAEIDSQTNENTITDWRNSRDILPHKIIKLPSEISDKCFELCHKLKLNFGAIDLIKDQNNNYWFLEINPNGQWAWLEKILDFKIADSIIDYLLS
jgi:hypothetical protein